MNKDKVLFCRVNWYEKYAGPEFEPHYGNNRDMQFEKYNFLEENCTYYGYCEPKSNNGGFNLDRIDKNNDGKKAECVTVIFFAQEPNSSKWLIVGVYENATIYARDYKNRFEWGSMYNISCDAYYGFLIPTHLRFIEMLPSSNTLEGSWGQRSWVWYTDKNKHQEWISKTLDKLEEIKPLCLDIKYLNMQEQLDNKITEEVEDIINKNIKITYSEVKTYERSSEARAYALQKANYMCEYDNSHKTFLRKNGTNYTEGHHLIPLCNNLESIDHYSNIVSLCPNCHRWIHQGKDNKIIITKLFNDRKEELSKVGIDITLERLLEIYKK